MRLKFRKIGKYQAELAELPQLSSLRTLVRCIGDGSMPADQAVACLLRLREVLPLEWWADVANVWVKRETAALPSLDAWGVLVLFRHVSEVAVVPGLAEVLAQRILLEGKGAEWFDAACDSLEWVDR